ncbi:LysM peptidoglycan-binding domain-containing protein [Pedobacter sp. MW01-1-1]|uniref:LysM peptidoglycan-binding domain-containing protein n=1 Tax=Pedobacter sp. MW01-1-1 TaxID=3383027 RepID=UPI003FEF2844
MHKFYITAVFLFAFHLTNAKSTVVRDSIGVENNKGKKLIVHKIDAKDTYYSIGRKYNVSPKDIMTFNDNKYLQIGVIIKVPTNIPYGAETATTTESNPSVYTVKPKDNLNLIAEKFGTTVNDLKALNNLKNNNLSIGQQLKVPTGTTTVQEPIETPKKEVPPSTTPAVTENTSTGFYTVKPKDNLNLIAQKFGTTVAELKNLNNLKSNNLSIGQQLKVPGGSTEAPSENTEKEAVITTKQASDTHTVAKGESIFSIAQKHGLTAYQIRKANNLDDNDLKVGQILKIPTNITTDVQVPKEKQTEKAVETAPVENKEDSFIYTVATGDNIYTIAKQFNLTTYQIRTANKLNDNTLKTGQKIIIPKAPLPKSVNDLSKEEQVENPDSTIIKEPKLRRDPSVYGLSQIEEKGAGIWIADPDLDGSKMLVLHRSAPVGNVIKITNPMTNRTTFAKVVGKFTENESTKDVIIVMTKAVAESLGALDKKFLCNLTYSAQ